MSKLRSPLAPPRVSREVSDPAWVTRSLIASIRRSALRTVAAWQGAMVLAALGSLGESGWLLAATYGAIGTYSLVSVRQQWCAIPVPIAMYLSGVLSLVVDGDIDSVLVVAARWQLICAGCVASLLFGRRILVPLVAACSVVAAALIMVLLPAWGARFPLVMMFTQILIVVAIRLGLPRLLRLAALTDAEEAAAAQALRRSQLEHRVSAQVAEEARVLHDTAINTLGAIAIGRHGTSDVTQVREQCAADLAALRLLGNDGAAEYAPSGDLHQLFGLPGLPIRRSGLDDEQVKRCSDRLETRIIGGILGCVREAVTNATKHSGADEVRIDLATDGNRLVIKVSDKGVGFAIDRSTRGIENSVRARALDHGFHARVVSEPGRGTAVELTVTMGQSTGPPRGTSTAHRTRGTAGLADGLGDVDAMIHRIHRRAGSLWSAGLTAIELALAVAGGSNRQHGLFLMVAIMAGLWLLTEFGHRSALNGWLVAALSCGGCAVFGLSATATDFGTTDAVHWKALAATGPFVLLLSYRPSRRQAACGFALWSALVLAIAAFAWTSSPNAAGIVLVAGCVGLGFCLVWARFQNAMGAMGAQGALAQRRNFESRLASDLDAAARSTYRRWLVAGLEPAAELLRHIAGGRLDPHAESTRRACSAEETYLRQLILISPELVHLGHAMLPTLSYARARGVHLVLRMGERDAPDEQAARTISSAVLQALDAMPTGGKLSASVFPVMDGLLITMRGERMRLDQLRVYDQGRPGPTMYIRYCRVGAEELFQMTLPFRTIDRR